MLHINGTTKTFYHFMACKAFGESYYPLRAKPLPSVSARHDFISRVLTDKWYQSHLTLLSCALYGLMLVHIRHFFVSVFLRLNTILCVLTAGTWRVESVHTLKSQSRRMVWLFCLNSVEKRWKEEGKTERERRREQVVVPVFSFPILACALAISTVSHLA